MPQTTISETSFQPTLDGLGDAPFIRFWYSQNFIAGDGATPVMSGNGQTGFYLDVTCSIVSGRLVMPATSLWATTDGSPGTSRLFGQLYSESGAPQPNMLIGANSGWQLPTVYGATITYDELARYNAAAYLLYPPPLYFTQDQTIAEILRLAGDQNYAGLNILGRTQLSLAPADAATPIAVGDNDPRVGGLTVLTNGTAIGQRLTVNFIPGANTGITGVDDSGSNRIDLTISATGGGGSPSFANPTAQIGLSTVNGSASTAMRSDGAPPLSQSIAPTWTGTHTFQAVPSFAPASAVAPFTLTANGQGQVVTGLRADELNKSISVSGLGLSGGGALTASRTIALASSSNPGAAASILASDADGYLQLVRLGIATAPTQPLEVGGNVFINAATANLYLKDTNTGFQSASTAVVTPQANNAIRSTSYTSGLVGWNISALGNAEFANVDVRGAIRSAVFVYNQILATGGTLGVFKAAAKLKSDVVVPAGPSYGSTTVTIDCVDQDGVSHAASQLFGVNDVLRMKDGLTGDTWFKVTAVSDQTTFWRYTASIQAGSANVTYRAGMAVVDYGAANAGFIILTADQTNAPYLQMATQDATFSSADANGILNVTPQLRLGNLNGSYGYATDIYGLGTGQYGASGSSWTTMDQTNGFRIGNNTTVLGQWDTTGAITVGQVSASQPNITLDSTNGIRMRINTTVVGQWLPSGNLNIGEIGAGKSFLHIDSGSLIFRNDAIERVKLTAAGVFTINDSAGAAVITLDASTGAEITKKLTMPGASSAIAIGPTPPTSASVGTGIWLDRTGLFGLLSNVVQAKVDATTGAIVGGAGDVLLNVDGLTLMGDTDVKTTNTIKWIDSGSSNTIGTIRSLRSGTPFKSVLAIGAASADVTGLGQLTVIAQNSSSAGPSIVLDSYGASHATKASKRYVRFDSVDGLLVTSFSTSADAVTSAALEVNSTTGAFLPPRMTSTERDALTATNGMVFYNSTTNKLQARAAGAWVDLH